MPNLTNEILENYNSNFRRSVRFKHTFIIQKNNINLLDNYKPIQLKFKIDTVHNISEKSFIFVIRDMQTDYIIYNETQENYDPFEHRHLFYNYILNLGDIKNIIFSKTNKLKLYNETLSLIYEKPKYLTRETDYNIYLFIQYMFLQFILKHYKDIIRNDFNAIFYNNNLYREIEGSKIG